MIKKIIIICLSILTLTVEARNKLYHHVENPDNEIEMLNFWSMNHVYNQQSLKIINKFTKLSSIKNNATLKEITKTIFTFEKTIKHIQLPKKQLRLLRRYAIAMEKHKLLFRSDMSRYLSDIIWLSEARLIDDKLEFIAFLTHQLKIKKRRELSFLMFIEKGFVNELIKLSKLISFKDSDSRFNIAIRQARIKRLFLSGKPVQRKTLISEVEWAASTIVLSQNTKRKIFDPRNINWLIIQFGIYRDKPVVNKLLNDMLKLSKFKQNSNILTSLNIEYKTLSSIIHNNKGVFSIIHQVKQAMEPFKLFEFFGDI